MYTLWNVFPISTSLKIQIFTKCIKMVDIPKCDDINREVFHHELDYQPGHVIHHGKTNRSYNRFPIAPSPVASHTRAKIRVVFCLFFCMVLPHGPSVACCHCGVRKNCSYMQTVHVRASLQPYTKVLAIKKSPTEQDVTIIRLHQLFQDHQSCARKQSP